MIASAEGHVPPGTVHAGVNVKGRLTYGVHVQCMIVFASLHAARWDNEVVVLIVIPGGLLVML